jgi:TRAP-type C4-dicarboxylate transport system permease small subunit
LLGGLAAIHDRITRIGFFCAGVCLVLIVLTYCYEVVARYFFSSPTFWASSLVAYLLCFTVFLVVPELSRDRTHITITIVLDVMPKKYARLLNRCAYATAALACLLAAGFCLDATLSQYARGIGTVNTWRIPKWPLSAVITYGLFSTSVYYVRHLLSPEGPAASEAETVRI